MTARRPALIFDFGNVIAFFDFARACGVYGRSLGLSGPDFLALLRERGLTEVLRDYERGALTSEGFRLAVSALGGFDMPHAEFAAAWADIFILNEPVARVVRALKARGYPLVLGSNTNDLHATHFRRQFADCLADFDSLVLSYEVGHLKPSPEFYLACADAARAGPSECVFIDDLPENVEGARAAGLHAVHFQDVPTLIDDLGNLGVDVGSAEG